MNEVTIRIKVYCNTPNLHLSKTFMPFEHVGQQHSGGNKCIFSFDVDTSSKFSISCLVTKIKKSNGFWLRDY